MTGPSDSSAVARHDIHVFFRAVPRRGLLSFRGKPPKPLAPGMTVEPTSGWLDFPALLAGRAPARTRTSLCSHMCACPAHPAAMLGVMQRRRAHFNTAIHGLLSHFVAD